MSRFILYTSKTNPLCQVTEWLCRSCELGFDERVITNEKDMSEIIERNPNKKLPVLQDGDLLLTEGCAILKYISELAIERGNCTKWPGFGKNDAKSNAKNDDLLAFSQSMVKSTILEYLHNMNQVFYDSVPDNSKIEKLNAVITELDYKKKGKSFMVSNSLTISDLYLFSLLYPLVSRNAFNWDKNKRLEGWFRVVTKIIRNEWTDEKQCLNCYESDSDEEDYMLAETIIDCVKNDRPDVLDKMAKDGANINMPLAVVEAVNRGNLAILKVMRDNDCYLKWPMAISMAMRFSKGEEILALLFGPGQTPEERKAEAEEILTNENKKMRVAMGLPEELTEEEKQEIERKKQLESQTPHNVVGGMPQFNQNVHTQNAVPQQPQVPQQPPVPPNNSVPQQSPVPPNNSVSGSGGGHPLQEGESSNHLQDNTPITETVKAVEGTAD